MSPNIVYEKMSSFVRNLGSFAFPTHRLTTFNMCLIFTTDQAHFAGQALKVHNFFRKMHTSPPLEINEELVRQALESVKQACMKATKRGDIAGKVGENVGTGCNFLNERVSAAEAVTNW